MSRSKSDAAAQIPTWAKSMQYGQATCAQLAHMSALPVLHFAGAQFAVKALSASTCLKVRPLKCSYTLRAPCSCSKQYMLCENLQDSDAFQVSSTQPHMSQPQAQINPHSLKSTQGFFQTLKAERHLCCTSASPGALRPPPLCRIRPAGVPQSPACCSWYTCQQRPDVFLDKILTPPVMHVQVQVPSELHLCEDTNEQEYCKARLLQPAGLAAYAAQRAHVQTQTPAPAKEEPEEGAKLAGGEAPGGFEGAGAVVKSEPSDGAVAGKVGRTAVGTLGRVKVPKGGFVK